MRPDGSGIEQLTHDERVNWFPHPSPDGTRLAYVSFPAGTQGHPADLDVLLRLCAPDGLDVRDLVSVHGGQGTMNVNSWTPDSRRLAYVDYPVGGWRAASTGPAQDARPGSACAPGGVA